MVWWLIISVPLIVGTLSGIISYYLGGSSRSSWFKCLRKPFLNPPNWIFAPMWTLLYILMGVAYFLSVNNAGHFLYIHSILFWSQMILNILWTPLFFLFHNLWLSFIDIVIMWSLILATTITFFFYSTAGGILMIP
jgi:benzodiazapine receptor